MPALLEPWRFGMAVATTWLKMWVAFQKDFLITLSFNCDKTKSCCLKFLLPEQNEVGQHDDNQEGVLTEELSI